MTPEDENKIQQLLEMCEEPPVDTEKIVSITMKKISLRRIRRLVAFFSSAAASVAVVLTLVSVHAFRGNKENLAASSFEGMNVFSVPPGAGATLHLSDGTLVEVNAASKVIYPESFSEDIREIYVDGEVYMDVAHDSARVFIVRTDAFDVKVHGTRFNVNTRRSLSCSDVVLEEGSVEISGHDGESVMLRPSQRAVFGSNGMSVETVDIEDYICWAKGYMIFHGVPLCEVAERLSLHYGIPVECRYREPLIYGKLEFKASLAESLGNIEKVSRISSRKTDKGYILEKE